MNKDNLITEVKQLIIETVGLEDIDAQNLNENKPLMQEIEDLDSVDFLEIALAVEKKYEVKIGNIETAKEVFKSINSISEYIYEKSR